MKKEEAKVVRLQHDGSNTMWYARAKLDLVKQQGVLIAINTANDKAVKWLPKIKDSLEAK